MCHIHDSQGQILALASRGTPSKRFCVLPLRSESGLTPFFVSSFPRPSLELISSLEVISILQLISNLKLSDLIVHAPCDGPPTISFEHQLDCPEVDSAARAGNLSAATERNVYRRILVYLVIYDSGYVSIEHLLLSRNPSHCGCDE